MLVAQVKHLHIAVKLVVKLVVDFALLVQKYLLYWYKSAQFEHRDSMPIYVDLKVEHHIYVYMYIYIYIIYTYYIYIYIYIVHPPTHPPTHIFKIRRP